jgi:iron complex outermembrane receptor protein
MGFLIGCWHRVLALSSIESFSGVKGDHEGSLANHWEWGCLKYLRVIVHIRRLFWLLLLGAGPLFAQSPSLDVETIAALSFEELLQLKVVTPTRVPTSIDETAQSVFVITRDDIQRSAYTTVPDLLRMAPGVNVSQISPHSWAISIRGQVQGFTNKVLVLIDGRSVYSPIFGGVNWSMVDVPVESIERIEILYGPAAAVWGVNAVNGVINVITRHTEDTTGGLAVVGAGTERQTRSAISFGGLLGEDVGSYRAYSHYQQADSSRDTAGNTIRDNGWRLGSTGLRADLNLNDRDDLFFSSQIYYGEEEKVTRRVQGVPPLVSAQRANIDLVGGHTHLRWDRDLGNDSSLSVSGIYGVDDQSAPEESVAVGSTVHTYELESKYTISPLEDHHLIIGMNYRGHQSLSRDGIADSFDPNFRELNTFSFFLQDAVQLNSDLLLYLGAKVEKFDSYDFELQPGIRAVWSLSEQVSFWASAARAVRVPTVIDRDLQAFAVDAFSRPEGGTGLVVFNSNFDLEPEYLIAYETGTRLKLSNKAYSTASFFYYDYQDALGASSSEPIAGKEVGSLVYPTTLDNGVDRSALGGELVVNYTPHSSVRFSAGYSYLKNHVTSESSAAQPFPENDPEHQAFLRTLIDVNSSLHLSAFLRFMDNSKSVDAYEELDLSAVWRVDPKLKLMLSGVNLLHDEHEEFGRSGINFHQSQVERAFFAQLLYDF